VRVTYFPSSSAILPVVDVTNLAWNRIIDLSETRDVTLSVGWCQPQPWGSTAMISGEFASPDSYALGENAVNGYIVMDVLNQLRAPLDPSSVQVIITVMGGEDFKLAVPQGNVIQGFAFDGTQIRTDFPSATFNFDVNTYTRTGSQPVVQMDSVPMGNAQGPQEVLVPSIGATDKWPLSHIGEQVGSLRALFKRSSAISNTLTSAAGMAYVLANCWEAGFPSFTWDAQSNTQMILAGVAT
jgi:hypothetical protein